MGDPEKGKQLFMRRCTQCHTTDKNDINKVGPNLFGIFNQKAGQNPSYTYSEAFTKASNVWDASSLDEFLTSPKQFMPGANMRYPELKSKDDRSNVIAYLKTLK